MPRSRTPGETPAGRPGCPSQRGRGPGATRRVGCRNPRSEPRGGRSPGPAGPGRGHLRMPSVPIGAVVGRYDALLTGRARFVADLDVADRLHLVFVRSPFAHARIATIETRDATAAPGVLGVFTAASLPTRPVWEIEMI